MQNASVRDLSGSGAVFSAMRSPGGEEVLHPLPIVVDPARGNDDDLDIVDEWGLQSFPASDSPQNW